MDRHPPKNEPLFMILLGCLCGISVLVSRRAGSLYNGFRVFKNKRHLSLLLYCNEFSENSINNLFYGRLFKCCHCEMRILPVIRRKKNRI